METQEHLFICPMTISKFDRIKIKTIESIDERLESVELYKSLKNQRDRPANSYLLYFLNDNHYFNSTFLTTPQARGLITKKLISEFTKAKRCKQDKGLWLFLTLDCWLSAFDEIIWKARCKALDADNEIEVESNTEEQPELLENTQD